MSIERTIRKLGFTAYGKVGSDAVRCSIAVVTEGLDTFTAFVAEDGSNAILPYAPTAFLTSGHVTTVAARSGVAYNLAALPWSAVAGGHEWKGKVTLRQLATRESYLGWTDAKVKAIKAELKAFYSEDVAIAA